MTEEERKKKMQGRDTGIAQDKIREEKDNRKKHITDWTTEHDGWSLID